MQPVSPHSQAQHAPGMAADIDDRQPQQQQQQQNNQSDSTSTSDQPTAPTASSTVADDDDSDASEDDSEPHFKYANLTSHLGSVYRNGDSASASLVSADKLILGTHNGNVHVLSIPSLRSIRTYHAHDASITSISVSPYSQVYSHNPQTASEKLEESPSSPAQPKSSTSRQAPKSAVPSTPSNQIFIATSSLDGCVCVSSLVDAKDVTVRNFKRPIQSVALSPEFKYDRAYLSAGLAGNLIHTTGGPAGVKTDANATGTAAAASGWLSQMGLGSNTGKDVSIHAGEGAISTLAWSLSGKYVAWVNEQGIKIARTNLFLHPDYASHAWTRICHIDKPSRRAWEDMAGVWKARAQWVDDRYLDSLDASPAGDDEGNGKVQSPKNVASPPSTPRKQAKRNEKLLVGWGDTVWVIEVDPKGQHLKKPGQSPALGKANFWKLELDDGIVAGLSLFTPTALLTLTYRTKDDNDRPTSATEKVAPKSGIRKRQNGLPPELRLISLEAGHEELDSEELKVRRFESLSVADYHLSTLFFSKPPKATGRQRNALGQLSDGLWDAGISATSRLFNSGASVRSGSSDDRTTASTALGSIKNVPSTDGPAAFPPAYAKPGLKVFLISPFDCFMGVKRDVSDHLKHLVESGKYQDAWNLLESNPEVVANQVAPDSRPATPTRTNSTLIDFFDDSSSVSTAAQTTQQARDAAVQREKRRIGDLWIEQLVGQKEWAAAGNVAAQALDTSHRWDHWISTFLEAGKFDEIVPHVPSHRLRPPVSGALYELALGHYVTADPVQLRRLISKWDASLFEAQTVVSAIETRLAKLSPQSGSSDPADDPTWRLLQSCLADLYLADGSAYDAVKCYIKAGDGDLAVRLVRENQLYTAISDQLYPFITVHMSSEQLKAASQATLDESSADSIHLLAVAASQGLIPVNQVIEDLQDRKHPGRMFLFFYFRTLFNGDVDKRDEFGELKKSQARRTRFAPLPSMNSTRVLLNSYADLAVTLFAEFDPALLNALIRTNDASADADLSGGALRFTFEHASAVCKARGLTSELVYLLALTGQTREALHLIADEMKDVPRAISFAREMNDRALWNDLLDYSLDKPPFIKGLLEEVGGGIGEDHDKEATAIDPLTLVKKIPEKLEIEGLKEALARILKDSEVQTSISEGAARVLRSEVVQIMEDLARARARGVVFEVAFDKLDQDQVPNDIPEDSPQVPADRQCTMCCKQYAIRFGEALIDPESQDYLLGFSCGHIVHLDCVLKVIKADYNERRIRNLQSKLDEAREADETDDQAWARGRVGSKMTRVRLIRDVLGSFQCRQCIHVGEASKSNDT